MPVLEIACPRLSMGHEHARQRHTYVIVPRCVALKDTIVMRIFDGLVLNRHARPSTQETLYITASRRWRLTYIMPPIPPLPGVGPLVA